ncbi:MAG TPA: PIG-L family deacetylase [Anaerolineales bacterium]|jgi:LmbE family N-acetylglucosaminyl deacetylase|nr:PIG-L family deacetylase [Anaerolineales bacterium]HLF88844.1 PIG-L family deacetylase [Anaerolineales bacterium]
MYFYGKKVLFVGAHPDDIELGCGALIAHIVDQCEVTCLTLSDNQKNPLLKNLVGEHRRSMGMLGVAEDHVIVEQFETRKFQQVRQEILETLVQLNSQNPPDIVFTHTSSDIHQDHATATQETLRAFRGTTVLGFDCLRSSYGFFPHFLVEVSEEDVQRKLRALAEYETYKTKYYFDPEIIKATLVRHGALAEKKYAEGFDILRIVGTFERPSR